MRILVILLSVCLYKVYVPKDLEMLLPVEWEYAEPKRKVAKRKKGKGLNFSAPYPINSSINGRKVNKSMRESQVTKNKV